MRPAMILWLSVHSMTVSFIGCKDIRHRSAKYDYRIERIAAGLNQPTYITQAPGDPANILYFTERTSGTIGGFRSVNQMGKIWRYDVQTRIKELVLDLSDRLVINDTGLHNIAFHPDFDRQGTPGYRKMYVTSSEGGPPAINRVEEYIVGPDGSAHFSRLILEYSNNVYDNHTVNWAGFDPTGMGDERHYLYISTGEGSFGNSYDGGVSPTGRPSQNPSSIAGKVLRVDVSGGDHYPADTYRNFGIPESNPIPTYNRIHPASQIDGLEEVWITGLRNAFRVSFDRCTGDFWIGDVGEVSWESIDFLKAGTNASGPPVDYGWPQWEGTKESTVEEAPHDVVNPFTGARSRRPVRQFRRRAGAAVIGGYVYRGPVTSLKGMYLFADFVGTGRVWMLEVRRATGARTFDWSSVRVENVSVRWQSLVFDPYDHSYQSSSDEFDVEGLDHIVSFGEDNAGNLYIVDFGNRSDGQSSFEGQYPGAGLGEIFRVTPTPRP